MGKVPLSAVIKHQDTEYNNIPEGKILSYRELQEYKKEGKPRKSTGRRKHIQTRLPRDLIHTGNEKRPPPFMEDFKI